MTTPFYQDTSVTIYKGDALTILKTLPDESVQMCMTSPPYWGLRNYAGGSDLIWGGDGKCNHIWEGSEYHEHREKIKSGKTRTTERFYGEPSRKFNGDHQKHYSNVFCTLCGAWRGQLGLEPTPELYVEHLMMIFQEIKRVLRKDGSFYLNIGDTYWGGKGQSAYAWSTEHTDRDTLQKPYHQITGMGETRPQDRWHPVLPPKCMTCIPERLLFAMVDDGWILRNKIIWHKPNSMPGSQKSRFTTSWEYVYFLVKNNKTILWRNRKTGEWRDVRPTKEENYPYGMYDEQGNRRQPLWMGFDSYFDLDAVREPHKTQSLERYQRQVNFGDRTPASKYAGTSPYPEGVQPIYREGRNLCPDWFKEMFSEDKDYKGKFDDIFGHGPQPQSFTLRVRDVKRGKRGVSAQGGELKASEKEVEEYDYPEKMPRHQGSGPQYKLSGLGRGSKHHGSSHDERAGMGILTKHDIAVGRTGNVSYTDPLHARDYSPKGKNPGDYWDITTQPSSICVCPKCEAVFPRYTKVCPSCNVEGVVGHFAPYPVALCETPIKASTRLGDVVLDPLAGGGNTGVAAKKLGRKCILIDCVKEYCIMARHKLSKVEYQPELGFSNIK